MNKELEDNIERAIEYIEMLLDRYDRNIDVDDQDLCHIIEILKGRE